MATKRTRRQSENKKEYNRIRRNLLAKLRYRKKQGFKVDYTTIPKNVERPTKSDITKLSKASVKLDSHGNVVVSHSTRQANVKPIESLDVELARKSKRLDYETGEIIDYSGKDYISLIITSLQQIHRKAQEIYDENFGHYMQFEQYEDISSAYEKVFENCMEIIQNNIDKYGEDKVNEYYKVNYHEISFSIAILVEHPPSDADEVFDGGEEIEYELSM